MNNIQINKNTLKGYFLETGVSESQFDLLEKYATKVLEINQITNLTGSKTPEDFLFKHILDSVLAFKESKSNQSIIYDVGSGCGVPGIVIAILSPNTKVSLVEIRVRKSECLKEIVSFLELEKRVSVINLGFEKLSKISNDAEIWFKGFMPGDKLIEFLSKHFTEGLNNTLVLMKGPRWSEELSQALSDKKAKDIWKNRFQESKETSYSLPNNEGQRILVKI